MPPGRSRDAAFSYEAISLEVFFILGPSLAALLVLLPWPGTGTAVALVLMVTGSAAFALTHAVRTHRPVPAAPAGLFGALAVPGLRTVVLASLGFGLVIGSVEVGVPAVTAAAGSAGARRGAALGLVDHVGAGRCRVLAAAVAAPLHLRLPALLLAFALCVGAMAVAGPLPALVVAMLLAGATITPQVTAHSLGVEATAPKGTATEAFGWVVTAATLGLSSGQSTAGMVVEAFGPHAAFAVGGVAGVVVAGAALAAPRLTTPAGSPAERAPRAQRQAIARGRRRRTRPRRRARARLRAEPRQGVAHLVEALLAVGEVGVGDGGDVGELRPVPGEHRRVGGEVGEPAQRLEVGPSAPSGWAITVVPLPSTVSPVSTALSGGEQERQRIRRAPASRPRAARRPPP